MGMGLRVPRPVGMAWTQEGGVHLGMGRGVGRDMRLGRCPVVRRRAKHPVRRSVRGGSVGGRGGLYGLGQPREIKPAHTGKKL